MFSKILKVVRPQVISRLVLSKSLTRMSVSAFGKSLEDVTKTKSKLHKALIKELKYEEENYAKDDTVEKTLKESGFELKENDYDNNLELIKKAGGLTIEVSFQSRPPPMAEEEEGKEKDPENPDQQQNADDICDFTVFIIKEDRSALVYECSSLDSELNVSSILPVVDIDSYRKVSRYERLSTQYNGPDFSTLDERLQTSTLEYLRDLGITDEVIAVVEHLSLDKEQRLYMKWLKDVSQFLN